MKKKKHSPSDAETRILKAARKLFLKHGFHGASTDMLAAEAKTSKMTMYRYFPKKMDLFKAFIDAESDTLYDATIELPETAEAFYGALEQFGLNLTSLLNDKEILRFDQLMVAQATKQPELSKLFYARAYERSCGHLEALIAHGQKKGFVKKQASAETLAFVLGNAWSGKAYHKRLYGIKSPMPKDMPKHVKQSIEIVLR